MHLLKSKTSKRLLIAAIALLPPALPAAITTWTGATGGEWGAAGNWDNGVPNAPGAEANINTALTVNVSDTGAGGAYPYTFGKLATNISSGNVVIGSATVTTDILRAQASAGVPEINVANGGGTIFFYANLEGDQGFNKTGAGKLTWRFNGADQDFTGNITISGGILGINQNGSLGNDNNNIFIAGGARLLAEPGSNSGTITLPGTRTITLTGAQSQVGSNNAAVNLVIQGTVTEDAAGKGLVKTDAGKVTLAGTLSYTGETRIAGGTLALSGPALLPSGQNLRFNGATGTLDLGGTAQTVRTIVMDNTAGNKTITGGGSLTINGDANQQLSANNGVTYDLSGIDSFTYDRANRNFNVQTVNAAGVTTLTDVNLAKSGPNGGVNTITAAQVLVGGGTSDGNNGNTVRLHLGTENTLNTATFQVGGFNAGGVVDFQAGLTNPFLKLRGADGASAATTWKIGETSSGSRRGEGVVNLTGGTLDALVTNLQMGRHIAGANINDTSSLTMPGGSLVAQAITMAEKTGGGTPTLTTTLNQGGGTVATGTLTLGLGTGTEAARLLPTYNLNGGTLLASSINATGADYAANSERNLNLAGGTLRNLAGSDLAVDGLNDTAAGRINVNVSAASAIHADAGQSVTLGANTLLGGSGALSKDGGGTLAIVAGPAHSYSGTLTVADGTLQAAGSLAAATVQIGDGATLAPGSSPGALTVGSLGLDAGSATVMDVDGSIAGTEHDQIVLSGGPLAYGGALTLVFGYALSGPDSFVLFNVTGASGTSGEFSSISLAGEYAGALSTAGSGIWTGKVGGYDWTFTNSTGTLTAVPEPSACALLLGCCALLCLMRRRRRR